MSATTVSLVIAAVAVLLLGLGCYVGYRVAKQAVRDEFEANWSIHHARIQEQLSGQVAAHGRLVDTVDAAWIAWQESTEHQMDLDALEEVETLLEEQRRWLNENPGTLSHTLDGGRDRRPRALEPRKLEDSSDGSSGEWPAIEGPRDSIPS